MNNYNVTRHAFTVPEFAYSANIGITYTYQKIKDGTIKAKKLGNKTLIPAAELSKFINNLPAYGGNNAEN